MVEQVTVIITTYDNGTGARNAVCLNTIDNLIHKLRYPNLKFLIVDDSDIAHPKYATHKFNIIERFTNNNISPRYISVNRRGVGYAKNAALTEAFSESPFVLLLEDDWILKDVLNLESYVKVLKDDPTAGMIRFGYLGSQTETLKARYRRGLPAMPWFCFWELERGSDIYVYSGQVSLRHKRFYDAVGDHAVGLAPGAEEEEMCKRYNATEDAPVILWPAHLGAPMGTGIFENTGLGISTNAVEPNK